MRRIVTGMTCTHARAGYPGQPAVNRATECGMMRTAVLFQCKCHYTKEISHAGTNAKPTAADLVADHPRRAPPRQHRDRLAPGRGRHPPQQLGPDRPPRAPGGQRAGRPAPRRGGPRGHAGLERYFGVSGPGRVLHTLNPRLHPEQLAWIVNHADDRAVCFDMTFLPLVQAVAGKCPGVKHWVSLCDADKLPADSGLPGLVSYEAWIGAQPDTYLWPDLDENSASSMCYTSGTTGNPKAALYSHRSTLLHAYGAALPDALGCSARDSILPVVPMFHVNAWGLPYSAAAVGCKLVFPGPAMDGKSVYELIESEKVSMAAGVPTVWQMLLGHMQQNDLRFSTMKRTVIGGSACPPAMINAFNDTYGVEVMQYWGMNEILPLCTVCPLQNAQLALPPEEQTKVRLKQGRAVFGVDMKIVNEAGEELPWDGKAYGDLLVRGPWIIASYFKGEGGDP